MKPFEFVQPSDLAEALRLLQAGEGQARVIAGGSDLLAELKEGIAGYEQLVSLSAIGGLAGIRPEGDGLWLGAMVTLTELETEPRLEGPWELLRQAARGVATPEIRNQGTLGGNLCQRNRCFYFRSRWTPCWKKGHMQCPALEGRHQHYLSVMGGVGCHAANPSDLAPALLVLDATVAIEGAEGERSVRMAEFFLPPGGDIARDNVLQPGEIVKGVRLPAPLAGWKGTALKARERTAGDFALVGVAVGFALTDGVIRHACLALGGAATVPLRFPEGEAALEGAPPNQETAARAAAAVFDAATPLPHNGFKVDLGRALVERAVTSLA